MRSRLAFLLSAALLSASYTTTAAAEGNFTLGVSAGSLGFGPELAYRFGPHLGLRANAAFYKHEDTEDLDDVEYDAELKLDSYGAMLDWYPFGGGFRFSIGGRVNNNVIELDGQPTTSVEIGDETFTPAQLGRLTGTVTTDSFAPALTLGYGGALAQGFTLGFELGVMKQGSPQIENLRATGGTFSNNPILLEQLAIEERQAEEDAEDYEYWPVVSLHVLYRF